MNEYLIYQIRSNFEMGATQSYKQSNIHTLYNPSDWLITQKLQHYQVWCEKKTGKSYDVYKLPRQILNDAAQLQKYQFRKMNGNYLVEVKAILDQDDSFICSRLGHVTLLTERIPYRFKNVVSVNFYEALIILKAAACGFNTLYPFYGTLEPTSDTICFNQYGYTKVWLNKDLSKNEKPQYDHITNKNIQNQQHDKNLNGILAANRVLSYDRVQKLFTLIQKKTINGFPFYFSKKAITIGTFADVINFVDQFKQKQKILIVGNAIPLQKFDNFIGSQQTIVCSRVLVSQHFGKKATKKLQKQQATEKNINEQIIIPQLQFKTNTKHKVNIRHNRMHEESIQISFRQSQKEFNRNSYQRKSSGIENISYEQFLQSKHEPAQSQRSQLAYPRQQEAVRQSRFSIQSKPQRNQQELKLYLPLNSDRQRIPVPIDSFSSRQGLQSKVTDNFSIIDYRSNSQGNWQRMNRNVSRQETNTDRSSHASNGPARSYLMQQPLTPTISNFNRQNRGPQSYCYFNYSKQAIISKNQDNKKIAKLPDKQKAEQQQQFVSISQGQIAPPPSIKTFANIKSFKQDAQDSGENYQSQTKQLNKLDQCEENKNEDQFNSIKQNSQSHYSRQNAQEDPFSTNLVGMERENVYQEQQDRYDRGFQQIPMDQSKPIYQDVSPTLSQRRKQRQDRYKKSSFIKQQNSQDYFSSGGVYSNNNLNDFIDSKAVCESHANQVESIVNQEIEQSQSPRSNKSQGFTQEQVQINAKIMDRDLALIKPSSIAQDNLNERDIEDMEAYIRQKYNIYANTQSNKQKQLNADVKSNQQHKNVSRDQLSKQQQESVKRATDKPRRNPFQLMNMSGSLQVMDLQLAVQNKLKNKQKELQDNNKSKKRPSLMQRSLQIIDLEKTLSKFNQKKEDQIKRQQESWQSHTKINQVTQQYIPETFGKKQDVNRRLANFQSSVFETKQEDNQVSKNLVSEILRDCQNFNNTPARQIKSRKHSEEPKYGDNTKPLYGSSNINRAYQKYVKNQNQRKTQAVQSIQSITLKGNLKNNQLQRQDTNKQKNRNRKRSKGYDSSQLDRQVFENTNNLKNMPKRKLEENAETPKMAEYIVYPKRKKQMMTYSQLRSYLWN